MKLDQALTDVAVLGAAGKMGSGIALLLLQEMVLHPHNQAILRLIDTNEAAFAGLRSYLTDQLRKRNIDPEKALKMVVFETAIESAKSSYLIFEAILEDVEVKAKVFKSIVSCGNDKGFFLSNTSSIPIALLNEKADLNNRIIGFHFYNPPAVQKLLEMITTPTTNPELVEIGYELAKRLHKTVVISNDVAGFIGNGHMIREIIFALQKIELLSQKYSLAQAIYMVNRVTQEWLLRPMGIMQLVDYVGIDVCNHVCTIMRTYLPDATLNMNLVETMLKNGIKGGQHADGSQKDGFFRYEKNKIRAVYSLEEEKYIEIKNDLLGDLPEGYHPWKELMKAPNRQQLIDDYLIQLHVQTTLGGRLAQEFLRNSSAISKKLVEDQVAASIDDVDTVLKNGFYHLI